MWDFARGSRPQIGNDFNVVTVRETEGVICDFARRSRPEKTICGNHYIVTVRKTGGKGVGFARRSRPKPGRNLYLVTARQTRGRGKYDYACGSRAMTGINFDVITVGETEWVVCDFARGSRSETISRNRHVLAVGETRAGLGFARGSRTKSRRNLHVFTVRNTRGRWICDFACGSRPKTGGDFDRSTVR